MGIAWECAIHQTGLIRFCSFRNKGRVYGFGQENISETVPGRLVSFPDPQ